MLLGHVGAPLYKALDESGLGGKLIDSGYDAGSRYAFFTVGLLGVNPRFRDRVVALIHDTVANLISEGIDPQDLERAVRRQEIRLRSLALESPLAIADAISHAWRYGNHPFQWLRIQDLTRLLHENLKQRPAYLRTLLNRMLADNPHHLVCTYFPDSGRQETKQENTRQRLETLAVQGDSQSLHRIAARQQRLQNVQDADAQCDTGRAMPAWLTRKDVSCPPWEIDVATEYAGATPIVTPQVPTNGLCYLTVALDCAGVPDELLDYLPIFAEILDKTGADGMDYEALAREEAKACTGLQFGLAVPEPVDAPEQTRPMLVISGMTTGESVPLMLDVIKRRLSAPNLQNRDRLQQIVREFRSARQEHFVPDAANFLSVHAARKMRLRDRLLDRLNWLRQYRLACGELKQCEHEIERISHVAEQLRQKVLSGGVAACAIAGKTENCEEVKSFVEDVAPGRGVVLSQNPLPESRGVRGDGLVHPVDVNMVAHVMPAAPFTSPQAPAALVLGQRLTNEYLWHQIRVRGGAYGVNAFYDDRSRVFAMSATEDPCPAQTLHIFRNAVHDALSHIDLSAEAMDRAVIAATRVLDAPLRGFDALGYALQNPLRNITPELRRSYRERLLALTPKELEDVVEYQKSVADQAVTSVFGPRATVEQLEKNQSDSAGGWQLTDTLP